MKLAKFFNHNFDAGVFRLYDKNNNEIYYENSKGYWIKREFDKNNNLIYYEDSKFYWSKTEFDKNNNEIYFEDSEGDIEDNRPKSSFENKIIEIEGIKYKLVKE